MSHVGKYDRANDRPKLAMLAANLRYHYWTDDRSRLEWWLRVYIGPKIAPDYRPRITARVKPTNFQIYNDINNENRIYNLA